MGENSISCPIFTSSLKKATEKKVRPQFNIAPLFGRNMLLYHFKGAPQCPVEILHCILLGILKYAAPVDFQDLSMVMSLSNMLAH